MKDLIAKVRESIFDNYKEFQFSFVIFYLNRLQQPVRYILMFLRIYFRKPLIAILGFFILYYLIYAIANQIDFPILIYTHWIYRLFGLPSDFKIDIFFITSITKFLVIALPLSITFFYFSYKEQKALSISSLSFWNNSTLLFGFLSISTIFIGKHLILITDNIKNISLNNLLSSNFSTDFSGLYLIWIIFVILTLSLGMNAIKLHINNLNINSQIDFAAGQVNYYLFDLIFGRFKNQRIYACGRIINSIDSMYQLLFLTIEKNTIVPYLDGIKKCSEVLASMIFDEDVSEYILGKNMQNNDEFAEKIYKSILRNHSNLIIKLLNNHRFSDAEDALRLLDDMESKRMEYYTALYELALVSFKLDILDYLLPRLNNSIKANKDKNENVNEINLIYKQLFIIAIEKSDIKSLSKISYSILKNFSSIPIVNKKKGRIPIPIIGTDKQDKLLNECIVYMIIQSLIKSIELSHYSSTGFLLKFLVTNFQGTLIKKVYANIIDNLISKRKQINPYLTTNRISEIEVSFNFNITTIRYCFEKMSILLYCQQKFMLTENVVINLHNDINPIINVSGISHSLEYLFNKIEKAGEKYGLLFLSKEKSDFIKNIKEELKDKTEKYKKSNNRSVKRR